MSAYTDMLAMRKRLEALEARTAGFVDNLNACHARLAAQEAEIVELRRIKPAPAQEVAPVRSPPDPAQVRISQVQRGIDMQARQPQESRQLLYAKPGQPHPSVAPQR